MHKNTFIHMLRNNTKTETFVLQRTLSRVKGQLSEWVNYRLHKLKEYVCIYVYIYSIIEFYNSIVSWQIIQLKMVSVLNVYPKIIHKFLVKTIMSITSQLLTGVSKIMKMIVKY